MMHVGVDRPRNRLLNVITYIVAAMNVFLTGPFSVFFFPEKNEVISQGNKMLQMFFVLNQIHCR